MPKIIMPRASGAQSHKYGVIYADPPWQCKGGFVPTVMYCSGYHYQTMKIRDICKIRVRDLVADDAVLFL